MASRVTKNSPKQPRVVKEENRHFPSKHLAQYNDKHYALYNPNDPPTTILVPRPFKSFSQYNHLSLYVNGNLKSFSQIPKEVVRLDDLSIFRVGLQYPIKELHSLWPSEFDHAGMVSARRYPLGRPAKMYAEVGAVDLDGNVIELGEQGWYYAWYYGLQILPGAEGAHLYQVRPSFEDMKEEKFGFKKGFKAVVQLENGKEPYQGDFYV